MEVVAILARAAVGSVLLFAGVSKLRTRAWGTLAMEMGTPRSVVTTLPTVEILFGLALITQLFPRVLSWLSVALFGAFTVVVARRVLIGSKAPCNCFGSNGSQEPVDMLTIVRNLLLVAVAVVGTLR